MEDHETIETIEETIGWCQLKLLKKDVNYKARSSRYIYVYVKLFQELRWKGVWELG